MPKVEFYITGKELKRLHKIPYKTSLGILESVRVKGFIGNWQINSTLLKIAKYLSSPASEKEKS